MEITTKMKPATLLPEWNGSPCPLDPDSFWVDDETGERVNAETGERYNYTSEQFATLRKRAHNPFGGRQVRALLRSLGEDA